MRRLDFPIHVTRSNLRPKAVNTRSEPISLRVDQKVEAALGARRFRYRREE